ncbi:Beta-glucanase [Dactylella cylindrospora]|nr:Beta-glucanase [Dactylella cylindrospora]
MSADFTSGANDRFTAVVSPEKITYTSDGAQFQVSGSGNSPTLASNFYIMFGRVDVTMKAAPGVGIVSSVVLQSDDLDEIDWEWLGGDNAQVQSNYFGKGNTATYDRAAFIPVSNPQTTEHTYTIEWTSKSIIWSIDGSPMRVLAVENSSGGGQYYPQTPMQIKLGAWSGGDPSNPPGTIQWAGGYTDYSQGPFNMFVRSISVQDYSTGTSYYYSDNSGSYLSIRSNGGTIGIDAVGDGGTGVVEAPQPTLTDIPIDGGIPYVVTSTPTTIATTTTRGPYTQPTSAEEYWAGTGFRVSSASTYTTDGNVEQNSLPYIVTDPPSSTSSFVTSTAVDGSVPVYIVTTGTGSNTNLDSFANSDGGGRRLDDIAVFGSSFSSSVLRNLVVAAAAGAWVVFFL